jgi:hypothetical protein
MTGEAPPLEPPCSPTDTLSEKLKTIMKDFTLINVLYLTTEITRGFLRPSKVF